MMQERFDQGQRELARSGACPGGGEREVGGVFEC